LQVHSGERQRAVGVGIGPEYDGVAHLLIAAPEQCVWYEKDEEGDDGAPLFARQRRVPAGRCLECPRFVRRQQRQCVEVNTKPDAHADAGGGEAVMPAHFLPERAADQRRQERADIDADIKDRIGAVAAVIAWRIEAADLR
jgi:hypothetical protein